MSARIRYPSFLAVRSKGGEITVDLHRAAGERRETSALIAQLDYGYIFAREHPVLFKGIT